MPDFEEKVVSIKVIGVGGAGNNVVNRMIAAGVGGVEFVVVNTDKQDLNKSNCRNKIQIGEKLTGGMGAGSKPDIGQKSAEESKAAISKVLEGTDMVFITAGMGGGTGTGAAPIIADLAHESGILTVGVVTKPFKFEGANRMKQAEAGIANLSDKVDSLIIIPNDRLKYVTDQKITFANAFGIADDVLKQAVQSISELVGYSEHVNINLDFADVSAIMKDAGRAHMGVGSATGRDKAEQAAQAAVASPLLETSINGAMGVLINITAPPTWVWTTWRPLPASSRRPPIPRPISSSARPSMTPWRTKCASPSSPRASTRRSPPPVWALSPPAWSAAAAVPPPHGGRQRHRRHFQNLQQELIPYLQRPACAGRFFAPPPMRPSRPAEVRRESGACSGGHTGRPYGVPSTWSAGRGAAGSACTGVFRCRGGLYGRPDRRGCANGENSV